MKQPETKKLIACILVASCVFVSLSFSLVSATDKATVNKKALAILGDAHHGVYPQYAAIVKQLQNKGYKTDAILDYKGQNRVRPKLSTHYFPRLSVY